MSDPRLTDEPGRLLALHRYRVLDRIREPEFDSITSIVKDLLGVPICAVSLVDADRQWFKSCQGLDVTQTPRSVAFCDHTIRSRRSLIIPDALADPRFAGNALVTGDPFIRSYAGAPLTSPDGYNLGALCAIDRQVRDFSEADTALLERFAKIVVDQLELRTLAHRDFLTGALTRRAFTDSATSALHQLGSSGRRAMVAVLDIDHFKAINDAHGHPTGDKVIKATAEAIQSQLRSSDLFGRLGGEEFGIFFNGAGEAQALASAERILAALANRRDPDCPSATASIGLSGVRRAEDLDLALAEADAALYSAKRGGRNRCVLAGHGAEFPKAA